MPRGVAITEPRQQLFAALEAVLAEAGPGRLTGRAVTQQAGVATGLLYAHFANFDDFLVGYAVDRTFQISGTVAGLPSRAGTGTVVANLSEILLATPLDTLLTLTRLLACRPDLAAGVQAILGEGVGALAAIEQAIAGYLAAERKLGRLPAGVDPSALALTMVAVLHHVVLTGGTAVAAQTRLGRTITALADAFSGGTDVDAERRP